MGPRKETLDLQILTCSIPAYGSPLIRVLNTPGNHNTPRVFSDRRNKMQQHLIWVEQTMLAESCIHVGCSERPNCFYVVRHHNQHTNKNTTCFLQTCEKHPPKGGGWVAVTKDELTILKS